MWFLVRVTERELEDKWVRLSWVTMQLFATRRTGLFPMVHLSTLVMAEDTSLYVSIIILFANI